jgi:hypothetical protein
MNPEYKACSVDQQQKRYLHYDEKRTQKIKQAINVEILVIYRKGRN